MVVHPVDKYSFVCYGPVGFMSKPCLLSELCDLEPSTILSSQLLQEDENMVRSVNSMNRRPLPHYTHCEVSSLIRRNVMWNNLMVEKAFCKCMDHSFGSSVVYSEGKSISRVSVYSSKNKTLSLPLILS